MLTHISHSQGFYAKLRAHLLPRIQAMHATMNIQGQEWDSGREDHVLLKNDRIYHHKQVRFIH